MNRPLEMVTVCLVVERCVLYQIVVNKVSPSHGLQSHHNAPHVYCACPFISSMSCYSVKDCYRPHSVASEGHVFTGVCHSLCPSGGTVERGGR